MEIESSSEESTSSSQEPRAFHFEDFCLFLACNLVGEESLQEEWVAKESLSGFSATWKSPLLIKVDPVTMERVDIDDSSTADLVYVTVSFLFQANQMSVFFGAFIHQNGSYYYQEGEPITEQFLQDHVEQHDVVMEDTKSFAIANAMTKALWQLNKQGAIKILQGPTEEIKIPLMYGDGDPSYLVLSSTNTTKPAPVDPILAKHLIRDCWFQGKKQSATPPKFAAEDTEKLLSQYLDWKDKAKDKIKEAAKKKAKEQEKEATAKATSVEKASPQKEGAAHAGKPSPTATGKDNTQNDVPPPNSKKKTKKKPMVHGFVMQKRKKAKK